METQADSFADPALGDEFGSTPPPVLPPVVAVMVTRNAGPWFERALASLRAQDYPSLTTLVLDAKSEADPTPRVAEILPSAFVRRLDADGFGGAANEAIAAVEGASYLLVCHDDVEFEPDAIRVLVEEAFRSNAGIAGPKIVDSDRPEVLLEVGRSIDRFGVPHTGVETGETDQEQHDGVRDVFYVSSAALLVRADLFGELGGFTPDAFPGAEDLDLCWRARLMGARVLVVPDARARHHVASTRREGVGVADTARVQRNRVRVLLTCYSRWTLLRVLPLAWALAAAEAVGFLITGQRERIRPVLGAWFGWRANASAVREQRAAVQAARVVDDRDLRFLQTRGSARLRSFLAGHLRIEERLEALGQAREARANRMNAMRKPLIITIAALVLAFIVGARGLVTGHISEVGSFVHFGSVGNLLSTFTDAWRGSGLGSPVMATPGFGLLGGLSTILFGATDLALTVVVVGSIPAGTVGVYRLVRHSAGAGLVPLLACVLYGINPLFRNGIAEGRLGALVFAALLPWFLLLVVAAAEWPRADGRPSELERKPRIRRIVGAGIVLGVMVSAYPPALLLAAAVGVAIVATVPLVGEPDRALRALRVIALAMAVALGLVVVWLVTTLLAGIEREPLGLVFEGEISLSGALRFETGPAGAGWTGWCGLIAAGAALLTATGGRWRGAVRGSMLALVGFALAWLPSQFGLAYPAVEGPLALAALGLALAAATGVSTLRDDLMRSRFGWRHIVTIAALAMLIGPALGFIADSGSGRYGQPSRDWAGSLEWMRAEKSNGQFRVLWVGDASVLPVDPVAEAASVDWALTRNAPDGVETLAPAPASEADAEISEAIAAAAAGSTSRLGRLLAPMGVRYVAVVERAAPGEGRVALADPAVTAGFRGQLDFAELSSEPGLRLFENRAWLPIEAMVEGEAPAAIDDPALLSASPIVATPVDRSVVPGTLLWGYAYDASWSATVDGNTLDHREAFGWANAFTVADAGDEVSISYGRSWQGPLFALMQVALWIAALVFALGLRRPHRRPRADAGNDEVDLSGDEPAAAATEVDA